MTAIKIVREDTQTTFELTPEELETYKRDGFFDRVLAVNPRAKFTVCENEMKLTI